MESENRVCQNCKNDFVIELDDFGFYEKMKVPPPTFCPNCRAQRRFMWRNERSLYKRPCSLCKKDFISIYSKNLPFPVLRISLIIIKMAIFLLVLEIVKIAPMLLELWD